MTAISLRPTSPGNRAVFARANCLATDALGDVVAISGPEVGGLMQVTRHTPTVNLTPPAVGVISRKLSATVCTVVLSGVMAGVYTGLTSGSRLFVDALGRLSTTPPAPAGAGTVAYVQVMGSAMASDRVLVLPRIPIKRRGF